MQLLLRQAGVTPNQTKGLSYDFDDDGELTGEIYKGQPVRRRQFPVNERVEPVLGVDDKPVWHVNPRNGERVRMKTHLVNDGYEFREYVITPTPQGSTLRNFHFRDDPNEAAAAAAKQAEDSAVSKLVAALEARGKTIEDLVEALDAAGEPDEPVKRPRGRPRKHPLPDAA